MISGLACVWCGCTIWCIVGCSAKTAVPVIEVTNSSPEHVLSDFGAMQTLNEVDNNDASSLANSLYDLVTEIDAPARLIIPRLGYGTVAGIELLLPLSSSVSCLVGWCLDYCEKHQLEGMVYLQFHRVFLLRMSVMYILSYHMRSLLDANLVSPLLKFEPILCSSFNRLKVCLPVIVKEFEHQSKAANLFQVATTYIGEDVLESRFSKAFGGIERLHMFFPFDPHLLKELDRFIRPIYNFWLVEMCNDSNVDEDEVLDAPEDDQLIEGHNDFDDISEKSIDYEDEHRSLFLFFRIRQLIEVHV